MRTINVSGYQVTVAHDPSHNRLRIGFFDGPGDDGRVYILLPTEARAISQALLEYALASEQAAAALPAKRQPEVEASTPPAPARHPFVKCPQYDTSCVHFTVPRRIVCHLPGCGKFSWHEVHA